MNKFDKVYELHKAAKFFGCSVVSYLFLQVVENHL